MKKTAILLAVAGALAAATTAQAHQTYNVGELNGPQATATGWNWSVGPSAGGNNAGGVPNTTGGADGAINNSQSSQLGAPVVTGNLVWRSGVGAVAPEYTGNLPEMWYSGLHTDATSFTRREIGTVSDPGGTPGGTGAGGGTTFFTPANSLDARIATWNTPAIISQGIGLNPNSQIAVGANSWTTGKELDYGVTHVTCGGTAEGCLAAGPLAINWTIKNLNALSTSLLGIAIYGGWDSSTTSSRTAAFDGTLINGLVNPQGSTLGAPLWSAVMSSPSDVLSYTRIFDMGEADKYDGHYTIIVGALNGTGDGQYYLSNTAKAPVPATVWLFGIGLAAMGWASRGRKEDSMGRMEA